MKKGVFFAIVLLSIVINCSFAEEQGNLDWKPVHSCIDLNQQLKSFLQSSQELKKPNFSENSTPPLLLWAKEILSESLFSIYDEKYHQLSLIQWPKNPGSPLIDFNSVKKLAKLRLPKSFTGVQSLFFKDQLFILYAREISAKDEETSILLLYEIKNGKLLPLQAIRQSGLTRKLKLHKEKLYLITEETIAEETLRKLPQQKLQISEITPRLSEALRYDLQMQEAKTLSCQDLEIRLSKGQLPSFWNILVLDLNNLQAPKQRASFLGNFEEFFFSKDLIYATTKEENQTLIQRFGLEPRLHYQKTELLSWVLLPWGLNFEGNASNWISKSSSGKLKRYEQSSFDSQFKKTKNQELFKGNEEFEQAGFLGTTPFLIKQDTPLFLFPESKGGSDTPVASFKLGQNTQTLLLSTSPLRFLQLQNQWNITLFQWYSLEQGKIVPGKQLSYPAKFELNAPLFWDQEAQILSLIMNDSQNAGKIILRGFKIEAEGTMKEIFARRYKLSNLQSLEFRNFTDFSVVISPQLIDLFLPHTPEKMKVLKR